MTAQPVGMRQDMQGCHWSALVAALQAAESSRPGVITANEHEGGACARVLKSAVSGMKRGANIRIISVELRRAMNSAVLDGKTGKYGVHGSVADDIYAFLGAGLGQTDLATDEWRGLWELTSAREKRCGACNGKGAVQSSARCTSVIYKQAVIQSAEASIDAAAMLDAQLTGGEIHDAVPTLCSVVGCDGVYTTTQAATSMPQILFVEIEGNNTERKVSVTDSNRVIAKVEYELIAVLYNRQNDHFFAQVKMNGRWYIANDCDDSFPLNSRCNGRHFSECNAGEFNSSMSTQLVHMLVYLQTGDGK
jgi:hypothetical protein